MYGPNTVTRGCVLPTGQPRPLTIADGVPRHSTDRVGTAEGSVNARGVLVMHDPLGMRFEVQIDGRGTVTSRFTGSCSYQMVLQKEGK